MTKAKWILVMMFLASAVNAFAAAKSTKVNVTKNEKNAQAAVKAGSCKWATGGDRNQVKRDSVPLKIASYLGTRTEPGKAKARATTPAVN